MTSPKYEIDTVVQDGHETMQVIIKLPMVKGMAELELETDKNTLVLKDKKQRYSNLRLDLPRPAIQHATKATFRKKKKELAVTLPCVDGATAPPAVGTLENPLGKDDSQVQVAPDGSITIPGMGGAGKLTRARDSLEDMQKIASASTASQEGPAQGGGGSGGGEALPEAPENLKGGDRKGPEPLAPPASFGAGLSDHSQSDYEEAEQLKAQGNDLLAKGRLDQAVQKYTAAIELAPGVAVYHANRASAYIRLESYALAIADAEEAIASDPNYVKGYYRRGTAYLAQNRPSLALPDFEEALRRVPNNKEAKAHVKACKDILRRHGGGGDLGGGGGGGGGGGAQSGGKIGGARDTNDLPSSLLGSLGGGLSGASDAMNRYLAPNSPNREAAAEHFRQLYDPLCVEVEDDYDGPRIDADEVNGTIPNDGRLTEDFVSSMVEYLRDERRLHKRYVLMILLGIRELLAKDKSLVDLHVPEGEDGRFTVCGDTHGQFYDLLEIFRINGTPSSENPYHFNGDFVDRGSFSVEVALTLFAYKLAYPDGLFLTRGNHESRTCNAMYGFEGEVLHKYDRSVMSLFTEVFNQLPLAACLDNSVMIVHGGLFDRDGVTLDEIREIDRYGEPPVQGLMCDLLWADPKMMPGRAPSKRGVSCMFGPDVTQRFLDDNGLKLLVRSHEVKPDGYEVMHDGRCITVFSAPNYCDQMGNRGAFITFGHDMVPKFTSFDAVPHPNIRPMAYQASSFSMFGF